MAVFRRERALTNNGVRIPGAVQGDCQGVTSSPLLVCNLYVLHDGVVGLVAVLSGAENPDWGHAMKALQALTARVSVGWWAFGVHVGAIVDGL